MCMVSIVPRGVEIDVSVAIAQTIEDINKASDENLEGHLLVLLTCKSWLQRGGGTMLGFHFSTF